jgi:hypothetical protein
LGAIFLKKVVAEVENCSVMVLYFSL